jgi:hypothetical protein
MYDADLLDIYLRRWAKETVFCTPHHPENKVMVLREYTDFGAAYELRWRIEDKRATESPMQPFSIHRLCNSLHVRREVERIEREVITPRVHAMLTQM